MKATLFKNIEDTLRQLEPEIPFTKESVELLAGTCAQESAYGKYRKQLGGGPALGIFQMEPATFHDCIENFLAYKPGLMAKVIKISGVDRLNPDDLEKNDILATCMCRVRYFRDKRPIPETLLGQAEYWKKIYNTYLGKGKVEEYIKNYDRYVLKGEES